MEKLKQFKPSFWDHKDVTTTLQDGGGFSFKKKWKLLVVFTSFMALLPLVVMSFVEFSLTRQTIEQKVRHVQLRELNAAVSALQFHPDIKTLPPEHLKQVVEQIFPDTGEASFEQDLFIINPTGRLMTDSEFYGNTGNETGISGLTRHAKATLIRKTVPGGAALLLGLARIQNTSFTMVSAMKAAAIKDLWLKPRLKLIWYLVLSILVILISIMGLSTYLVSRIHLADRKRSEAIHHVEYANRLASIGRLASGVAHEINNPLAIINQKTGLMMDLVSMNEALDQDGRLASLAEDVHGAVRRCSSITRRLQDFARHMEPSIEMVNVPEVISQVLGFLEQEALRRDIDVNFQVKTPPPEFECDKGSMQQIFLNLFDNAFTAMPDGGTLKILVNYTRKKILRVQISDNGIGISNEDIEKIFEPFYASKSGHWGTGIGLSITFNLIKELGGNISINSQLNKGTTVTLHFPVTDRGKPANETPDK